MDSHYNIGFSVYCGPALHVEHPYILVEMLHYLPIKPNLTYHGNIIKVMFSCRRNKLFSHMQSEYVIDAPWR